MEKVLCGERVFPIPTRNTRKIEKRSKGNGSSSQKKGDNCKTNPTKKYYLCNPKAVKRKDYSVMVQRLLKKAGGNE